MFAQLAGLARGDGMLDRGDVGALAEFLDEIDSMEGDRPGPARRGRSAR
jgi:hypothetical protein